MTRVYQVEMILVNIARGFRCFRGAQRLWWGWCPACNSDAPELYTCRVCNPVKADKWPGHTPDLPYRIVDKSALWERFKERDYK